MLTLYLIPWSLGTPDGGLTKTDKAQLHVLERESGSHEPVIAPPNSVYVIDGNALIRSLTHLPETFGEFALQVFQAMPICQTIHFVTDTYKQHSIKGLERSRRGKGSVLLLSGSLRKLPRDFGSFMHDSQNKRQLINFLFTQWQLPSYASVLSGRNIYFVCEEKCARLSSDDGIIVTVADVMELHSSQEEADTRIILHCMFSAKHCMDLPQTIVVRSPDTDVFVLLVSCCMAIKVPILFDTGTGNKRRLIDINKIQSVLGEDISQALPGFHAFTGCDTTSAFVRRGKRGPLTLMRRNAKFCSAFKSLGQAPDHIDEDVAQKLEQFVCAMYGYPKSTDTNKLRSLIFQTLYGCKMPLLDQ